VESSGKVGEGGQMGVTICVYKGDMTEGAMNSLDIVEMRRMSLKSVEEVLNMVKEFKLLDRGKTNLPCWDVLGQH